MGPILRSRKNSLRLKNFDYSLAGGYFVTLTTWQRIPLFGNITDNKVQLNLAGQCAAVLLQNLPRHFSICLDTWVIMPDHLHAILILESRTGEASGRQSGLSKINITPDASARPQGTLPGSLGAVIQNYKSLTTRRINALRNTPDQPVWQRNYYEHIIRDDNDLDRIRVYIRDNPAKWLKNIPSCVDKK
jgi:putative transposase